MENELRYFLKKDNKLKSRKAIDQLFVEGSFFSIFPIRVSYKLIDNSVGFKIGFTASSKNFKKATDRNRIKRLMREAFRLQKNELIQNKKLEQKAIHIFLIYVGKEVPKYNLIFEKMQNVIKRLHKILYEAAE